MNEYLDSSSEPLGSEENEFEILSSGFDRIPTTLKKLSEEQEADVNKLLEKIEDDDDVQNVYHNMQ